MTGVICGHPAADIENPLTRPVRYLDKLVNELARGKSTEKILREGLGRPGGRGGRGVNRTAEGAGVAGERREGISNLSPQGGERSTTRQRRRVRGLRGSLA